MVDFVVLLVAGMLGGMLNSIAGGGSFITFPALIFVGIPPLIANTTNTFSSSAGYISGALAFKEELKQSQYLKSTIILSMLGGIAGAMLLLQIPNALFKDFVPWLLLVATILFSFGERINLFLSQSSLTKSRIAKRSGSLTGFLLFIVCLYGGFFNAGLGILLLTYFVLIGHKNINTMNGLKLVSSAIVSVFAVLLFTIDGKIAWYEGFLLMLGTVSGGYIAARISKLLNPKLVRTFVIFLSLFVSTYFFLEVYFIA